jgi:PAS domain S-box-containing protein
MQPQLEHPHDEIKRLQRCNNDLVSILALPAIWSGGEPSQIVHTFLDALLGMLGLDLVYVRLTEPVGEAPIETARVAQWLKLTTRPHEIGEMLNHWLGDDPQKWPALVRKPIGEEAISVVPLRLGLHGEIGILLVGSQRADFPCQTETLLLSVAANQASIGLQEARLRNQQKRVSSELDQQVAQRTAELAAANEELKRELTERRVVEERLQQEESELKRTEVRKAAILDSALDCIVTINHEGRITEFNPAAERTFGYRHDEVVGRYMADVIVPPSLREKHRQGFARYLATGDARVLGQRIEMTAVRADGSEFPVELAITRTPLDGPPSFTGYLRDITEHKRNENALSEAHARVARSEERWRSVFENSAIGVALTDLNGRFIATNPVYQEMLGYTGEELQKLSFLDITHEENREPNRTLIGELLAGKRQQFQIEKQYRRKNGSLVWVRNNVSIVPGSERVPRFLMALSEDITERKQAEEKLRASETNLRQIVDGIPGLVCTMSPGGTLEHFNQQVLDYFGRTAEELRNWAFNDSVHQEDLPRVIEVFSHSIATGEPYDIEHRCRRADGVYRWFQVRALPVRDSGGRITVWYVLLTDIDDRRKAEEDLRLRESRFHAILDGLPAFVSFMMPSGDVEFANQTILDYFGAPWEEVKGWPGGSTLHPDDREAVLAAWRRSLESGQLYEFEGRHRRSDGAYRWFHMKGGPLWDAEGRIVLWYLMQIDVDDQKRAEQALQANERELGLIVSTIPALAWSARPDGSAEFFNQHYLAYVGLPLEQLQGSGWTAAVHPDDLGALTVAWQSMMAAGKGGEVEGRLRRFDGEYRWFLFRANPMLDGSGNILKWYGTNTDIHDRKRAEEQLRRSEAFLTEGQKLSRIGNFSWLVATDEIKWSDQLYRIFEFELGVPVTFELIGSRVHPEDLPLMFDMIGKAQRGVSDFEYEQRLLMPDRSIKYLQLIGHGTRDREGRQEYIGAVQDVTQRRFSEEALGKARSELANVARVTSLGVLTASIAHEVNQPLSGIITNASTCLRMLSADPPNVEGARETARRAIRDGNRASDVVTRLRTLYSKKDLSPESMDLNEATREVTSLSLSELQSKRVILRHELADDLPPVIGDRVQLQQVILNLLRNASDAMSGVDDRPRELLIRTECDEGDRVRLSVKDAGVGFTPQAGDKLFEAFFTTKSDGMGIGLSISRSIIEAHRGRLWATANDGPGATFAFSIPCRRESLADAETRVN